MPRLEIIRLLISKNQITTVLALTMIFMFLRSAAQVREYKGQVASKELENRKIVYENVNSQYISEDASTETD